MSFWGTSVTGKRAFCVTEVLKALSRVSGRDGRCNNPGVIGGKGRINAGFPRILAFLCNNPGGNGCFSGIIVVLRRPVRLGETERGYGDWTTLGGVQRHCHPERNDASVILNGTKWSEGSVTDSSLTISSHLHVSKKRRLTLIYCTFCGLSCKTSKK